MVTGVLKRLIRNWSLERKSLLLLGTALLASICISFFAVENIAVRLVNEITRQAAQHFANSLYIWEHSKKYLGKLDADKPRGDASSDTIPKVLDINTNYKYSYLLLDDNSWFESMSVTAPENDDIKKILVRLRAKIIASQQNTTDPQTSDDLDTKKLDADRPLGSSDKVDTPYSIGKPNEKKIFEEVGPIDGIYYYYTPFPIALTGDCYVCHVPHRNEPSKVFASTALTADKNSAAVPDPFPFIAVRVQIPYTNSREWLILIFALNIAIAIATMAITLFFIHRVLKGLVIRPLRHLRDVSDEISRGQTSLRADIDTGDEFHELAESFNRMLRHLTDTQTQLQTVNSELDRRVDQLAQANLQLYEGNRLKSDFLANMSHELRTPLNSIIGFSDVLQKFDSLNDKQKRFAFNIQNSGRILLDMINDILDLAKVEAGKMEVRPTHFELQKIVAGQCEIVRSLSDQKNIDIRVETAILDLTIYQDQTKLQQILTNLLSNAIKFTPEGGLISVSSGLINDDRCFITVADTGVGIAECDFEIIFEKFRQSSTIVQGDGLTREYSGTGLGLSIVRELCKLLGGEINLESELGKGSTFQIVLPTHYQPIDSIDLVPPVEFNQPVHHNHDRAKDSFEPF